MCTSESREAVARFDEIAFQFPSNGKAYMHEVAATITAMQATEFQFPSNGKAYMHLTI